MVPIYTHFDTDDWLIRAYTKCNAYSAQTGSVLANWWVQGHEGWLHVFQACTELHLM
jgi:hypothetical protein